MADIEATLSFNADPAEFARASAWLAGLCQAHGVPSDQMDRLDICLNEALANVLSHGGADALTAPITLKLALVMAAHEGKACMTLIAGGVPFDPATHVTRAMPTTLETAEPGGLGVLLMRANADEIHYRRIGQLNCTDFRFGWIPPVGAK